MACGGCKPKGASLKKHRANMIKMKAFSVYFDELTGTYLCQNWSSRNKMYQRKSKINIQVMLQEMALEICPMRGT